MNKNNLEQKKLNVKQKELNVQQKELNIEPKELYMVHQQQIQSMQTQLHEVDTRNIKIEERVNYLCSRIDNGISATITKMWDKMNNDIMPVVNDSKYWIGLVKKTITLLIIGTVLKLVWDNVPQILGMLHG